MSNNHWSMKTKTVNLLVPGPHGAQVMVSDIQSFEKYTSFVGTMMSYDCFLLYLKEEINIKYIENNVFQAKNVDTYCDSLYTAHEKAIWLQDAVIKVDLKKYHLKFFF